METDVHKIFKIESNSLAKSININAKALSVCVLCIKRKNSLLLQKVICCCYCCRSSLCGLHNLFGVHQFFFYLSAIRFRIAKTKKYVLSFVCIHCGVQYFLFWALFFSVSSFRCVYVYEGFFLLFASVMQKMCRLTNETKNAEKKRNRKKRSQFEHILLLHGKPV